MPRQVLTYGDGDWPIHSWAGTRTVHDSRSSASDLEPDIEPGALEQLRLLTKLPFVHPHGVAVMPDVHQGIGSTVGTVIATRMALIPAAVGVDIGCGMVAVRTSLTASDLPDSLSALRHSIERGVPVGNAYNREDRWDDLDGSLYERMMSCVPHELMAKPVGQSVGKQLGTLGGGNHFIEVSLDEDQRVWVLLHSGSRGIGNQIGGYFIEKAQRIAEKYFIPLPHKDLAYLVQGTEEFEDYWLALKWAQDFAMQNRQIMLGEVLNSLMHGVRPFELTEEAVNCHHNYAELENHFGKNVYVTRKGAIRAREGDLGIIPGSMGTRSYIVRGKGNADAYHSCSHGAGRRMSRKAARNSHTVADLVAQTQGVECRKDEAILDELPAAYKNIDDVMENQRDLVEVLHTLKAVLCVKGA